MRCTVRLGLGGCFKTHLTATRRIVNHQASEYTPSALHGCTNALPRLSSTDENALVACDVAVETAEARAAEAEGLAQRCLLERDELLQRVEAEAEVRRGRERR